jgi:gas vesicle protein
VLGASIALLFAPNSGSETRQGLRHKLWEDSDSVWQKLGDELKKAATLRRKDGVEEVEELV